jgi:hypothetical protein
MLVMVLGMALLAFGCQATIGNTSLWARPTVRIPPRSIETGDGEQVFMDGYTPRGDSVFIVIRVYPKGKERLTGSGIQKWSEAVRDKLKSGGD